MTLKITIIGLGQVGTSIGLALKSYTEKVDRVGHDKSRRIANQAKTMGAVDRVAITLSGSVKKADIVFLALPMQEIKPVLEHIAQDLKEEALVIDTAPIKSPVQGWMEEFLPEGVSSVGITPVIKPEYLEESAYGVDAAHEDLFEDSLLAVVTGKKTDQTAVKMATQLIELLGGDPFFIDPAEIDGLMTQIHLLPRLLSSVLLDATVDQPGWREAQKLAGKEFARVSKPLSADDQPGALASMMVKNQENTVRVINELIRTLVRYRELAEAGSEGELVDLFENYQRQRDLWWQDRQEGKWSDNIASQKLEPSSMLGDLFGFRGPRQPDEDED
jgi:prephenate dehydrogenase